MRYRYKQVDVFTSQQFKGNPLAVIFDADSMSTEEMQQIAYLMDQAVTHRNNEEELKKVAEVVHHLTEIFPVYKDLRG